ASSVPPAREIADLLGRAGGPGSPDELGLAAEDVKQALASSRYLRNRFTVNTVGRIVGAW
ncbi:MAG: sn-glycerol-1-phosphate dehydrogenase, partial [Chloroflexi bacterium]|nr:sn-glycerol-1-phosphate dehydrogenase [Chloroflexota bacterium]